MPAGGGQDVNTEIVTTILEMNGATGQWALSRKAGKAYGNVASVSLQGTQLECAKEEKNV